MDQFVDGLSQATDVLTDAGRVVGQHSVSYGSALWQQVGNLKIGNNKIVNNNSNSSSTSSSAAVGNSHQPSSTSTSTAQSSQTSSSMSIAVCAKTLLGLAAVKYSASAAYNLYAYSAMKSRRKAFEEKLHKECQGKDVVYIFTSVPRLIPGRPNAVGWPTKLETFCRVHKISYEFHVAPEYMALAPPPSHTVPFIYLNNTLISDSDRAVEFIAQTILQLQPADDDHHHLGEEQQQQYSEHQSLSYAHLKPAERAVSTLLRRTLTYHTTVQLAQRNVIVDNLVPHLTLVRDGMEKIIRNLLPLVRQIESLYVSFKKYPSLKSIPPVFQSLYGKMMMRGEARHHLLPSNSSNAAEKKSDPAAADRTEEEGKQQQPQQQQKHHASPPQLIPPIPVGVMATLIKYTYQQKIQSTLMLTGMGKWTDAEYQGDLIDDLKSFEILLVTQNGNPPTPPETAAASASSSSTETKNSNDNRIRTASYDVVEQDETASACSNDDDKGQNNNNTTNNNNNDFDHVTPPGELIESFAAAASSATATPNQDEVNDEENHRRKSQKQLVDDSVEGYFLFGGEHASTMDCALFGLLSSVHPDAHKVFTKNTAALQYLQRSAPLQHFVRVMMTKYWCDVCHISPMRSGSKQVFRF